VHAEFGKAQDSLEIERMVQAGIIPTNGKDSV
jgi:hypothetical protein